MPRAESSLSKVGRLIGTAERHIAAGKYDLALDQLLTAQSLDPENQYIQAIIERIDLFQKNRNGIPAGLDQNNGLARPQTFEGSAEDVLAQIKRGIGDLGDEAFLSPQDLQARVRRLTAVAANLFERGSFELAFDSLMKAYLLDPNSPHVIACERTLLPAWDLLKKRNAPTPPPVQEPSDSSAHPLDGILSQHLEAITYGGIPTPEDPSQGRRLEELKLQKETERLESERAMWREASRPPRILTMPEDSPPQQASEPEPETESPLMAFFKKLKQGKFLS